MRRAFLRPEVSMSNDDVRPAFRVITGGATPAPAKHLRDEPTFVAIAIDDLYKFQVALRMLTPCSRNPHRFHEWKSELDATLTEWATRLPVPNAPA
jgi:hypothetical protein